MLKAAGSLRNSERPAKGVQFAVVVQQEGGEEVVTTHVLGYVEPVMHSCSHQDQSTCVDASRRDQETKH